MERPDKIHFTRAGDLHPILSAALAGYSRVMILADRNTEKYCLPLLTEAMPELRKAGLISLDPGEDEKNIASLHHIWSSLLHHGSGKQSCLLNLGGGMITDIGGFAASTFMRGISFIHMPTTLLGMVDAAIGGKTAINIGKVKNQAGTFALPAQVIVCPEFLDTLSEEDLLSGYAEMLKTAILLDKEMLDDLLKNEAELKNIRSHIRAAALHKEAVIEKDFRDRGERQCLNFGHSVGHALEAFSLKRGREVKHGFAVAAGILCEARISKEIYSIPEKKLSGIEQHILLTFPAIEFTEKDIDSILGLIRHDKKNFGNDLRMSLIEDIGKCRTGIPCREEQIIESLKYYLSITGS